MKRKLLSTAAVLSVAFMLIACAAKSPKEKVIDALNNAIERVDQASSRKKLECASQRLILDYKKIFKDMSHSEQNHIMNSKEVCDLQSEYNLKMTQKLKTVK